MKRPKIEVYSYKGGRSSGWIKGLIALVLAGVLGFASAVSPALKSASLDPQTAITQGEVN